MADRPGLKTETPPMCLALLAGSRRFVGLFAGQPEVLHGAARGPSPDAALRGDSGPGTQKSGDLSFVWDFWNNFPSWPKSLAWG